MTDFTAIHAASMSLKGVLERAITSSTEPHLAGVQIDLRSPQEMRDESKQGVSVWLFLVRRDADTYNLPPRITHPDRVPSRPITLELGYLITPVIDDTETRHVVLGRVIETLNDAAPIRGADLAESLAGTDDELLVHLDAGALPDPFRIWDAMNLPYEVCVPYLVEHVVIESTKPQRQAPRVVERTATYTQVVSSGAPT